MAQHRTTAADPAEAILAAIGRLGQATAPTTPGDPTPGDTTPGDATTGDATPGDGAPGDGPGADEVHAIDEVDSGAAGDTEQVAGTGQPADVSASHPAAETAEPAAGGRAHDPADSAKPRRAHGTLRGAVLDILEAHPGQGFKVGELCKLIDATNEGSEVAKASPGAVVLACQRLVAKGNGVLAVEKPATFQLATGGE